jgi:hypothetical protein
MEQSPCWEANNHSASQEIHGLLWNPKAHYSVHKSPPLVPNLGQMNPIHTFPSCSPKIHSNIIFLFTRRSSKLSLPFRPFDQNSVCISHLPHACYMTLSHSSSTWSCVRACDITNKQDPRSRFFLEKLTVTQLVKKFSAFYGTRRFITVFTTARHWSLSWARWTQSTPSHPIPLRSTLILPSA